MSNSVGHFFTSLLAKILFGILILAFGAWGVADMLKRSPEKQAVIGVGDVEVSSRQVKRAFVSELRRLRQQFGSQLTAADAAKFGVFDQVLSQMASRALLDAAASRMNVGVSDAAIQELIVGNNVFQGEDGRFSRERFRRVLENSGYSENDFLFMTRHDMVRGRLLDSVREPVTVPEILATTLLRYEAERRIAEVFAVTADAMPQPQDPGDEVLTAYQKDHAAEYTAPEIRRLTVLAIRPDDVRDQISVSEDDLHDYFERHSGDFVRPETRHLRQILVKDEAAAAQVSAALKEGRAADAVAKEAKSTLTDLGWVAREGILSALGEPAFAATKGEVLPPLKTPLGWHVVVVEDIRPARALDFAEAKPKAAEAARAERMLAAIYRLSTALEDSLAAGASLEEAARLNKLSVVTVDATDAEGKTPGGDPVEGLPATAEIVRAGFAQETGNQSSLMEYEGEPGGYFVVRTDATTPAALKPFARVRGDLLAAWRNEQRHQAAREKAKALAADFATAKDAAAFAKAHGVKIETTQPFFRSGGARGLPRDLVKSIFALDPGQAGSAATPEGAMVARLTEVRPADLAEFAGAMEQGKRQLRAALGDALMVPFTTQLTDAFPIRQFRSVESLMREIN
jgi:peptidyl-prolyl cis-trans isomerase D